MKKFLFTLLIAILPIAAVAVAWHDDPTHSTTQGKVSHVLWTSANLVQHKVGLRAPAFGARLRFDSNGNPIGNGDPAPLTNGGFLQVASVNVEGRQIRVKGKRIVLTGTACDKGILTSELVEITIESSTTPLDDASASRALSAVFLSDDEVTNRLHNYYQGGAADVFRQAREQGGSIGTLAGTQPIFLVGHGTTAPKVSHSPDPEYTEAARRARQTGAVVLYIVIDQNGIPQVITVARSLGMGLDENAEYAASQWRFHPAMRDGKPVAVAINIEVNFKM